MPAQWKDVTTYRRGEPKEASSWELKGPKSFILLVHTYLNYPGWYLTCYGLRIERQELKGGRDQVREEALEIIDKRLREMRAEFDYATTQKSKKKPTKPKKAKV